MDLFNKPSAADLVLAVRGHLEQAVLHKLDGEDAFNLRVSIHALGIVERQLRIGPELAQADRAQLATLPGVAAEPAAAQTLVERLRLGTLGLETPGLLDYLTEHTLRRLSVDNPRYRHE